jgi:hypothetical protein
VATRRVAKARDEAGIVAREVGSRQELPIEVEVEVEVGVIDDKMSIVAVSGLYTDVAVRAVVEVQNSTLRGARRK